MPAETLLLVGAGHAHLHLVRHADRLARAGYRVVLVAPRWFDYSGVASGIAAGGRDPDEGRLDVAALTRGLLEHRATVVTDVDVAGRTARTEEGEVLGWDVLSLNIGSVAAAPDGLPLPGGVLRVKPLSSLSGLRDRLEHAPAGRGHHVTVVGAGASGVELAAHLAARADTDRVHLLDAGPRVGPPLPARARRRLSALLAHRGVEVRTGIGVRSLEEEALTLDDGTRLPHDTVVLATGLAPPPLVARSGLGGPAGIPVRATLQHRDHDDVYAAGDCTDFLPRSLPRIGVHGVRQGPVLLEALEARTTGATAPTYRPQSRALSVLDLGGGTALAVRGRWWWLGRSSLRLKRRIDRRWIEGYRT